MMLREPQLLWAQWVFPENYQVLLKFLEAQLLLHHDNPNSLSTRIGWTASNNSGRGLFTNSTKINILPIPNTLIPTNRFCLDTFLVSNRSLKRARSCPTSFPNLIIHHHHQTTISIYLHSCDLHSIPLCLVGVKNILSILRGKMKKIMRTTIHLTLTLITSGGGQGNMHLRCRYPLSMYLSGKEMTIEDIWKHLSMINAGTFCTTSITIHLSYPGLMRALDASRWPAPLSWPRLGEGWNKTGETNKCRMID